MYKQQRGGTIIGFILGVIVGLGIALGVAVYVTKVPVPFLNKDTSRPQAISEAERNRNWDPNSPLYGGAAGRSNPAAGPVTSAPGPTTAPKPAVVDPTAAGQTPAGGADPLGALAQAQLQAAQAKEAASAAASTATAAAAQTASSNAPAASDDGFQYFVQAGAFRTQADADGQRAKLAMMGWEARVSEREQNGRPVFRVRVGPFTKRGEAEQLKVRLDDSGIESALVRVRQ